MPNYIPKEQLEAYRRWEADAFDKPPAPPPAVAAPVEIPREEEPEVVAAIPLPTAADIERIHEEARAAGYATGFEEGRAAGLAAGQETVRGTAEQLAALADNLRRALAEVDQAVADDLLALAVEIAGQVLRTTLAADTSALLPVVREALAALPMHHGHVTLHVCPDDAEVLRQHLGEHFSHAGWRVLEDREIAAGGCLVKAGNSEVDATLATRWQRVLESIGLAENDTRNPR